ncbi:MAG: hypothetical protein B7X76_10515, partial [Azorhizobium sp. 39-67-5]
MISRAALSVFAALLALAMFALPAPAVAQQNAAADSSLRLRVGDILTIAMPGEPAFNRDFLIDRSGRITLPEVGDVDLAGRTMAEATLEVREALSKAFRDLGRMTVTLKER